MAAILLLRRLNHGTDGLHEMIEGANQTRPASRCPQRHICPSGRPLQRCGNERHRSALGMHTGCTGQKKEQPTTNRLERLLTLQRGHWFGAWVGQALASLGLHVLPQLEISWQHQGVPVKAHLDLCWYGVRPSMPCEFLK